MMTEVQGSRTPVDELLLTLADYALSTTEPAPEALEAARLCLLDALGCAFLALQDVECRCRLGPVVPGALLPGGARVPGTDLELDPVQATFNTGCLIRWLDYNDTWLAAEWGHPSDNLAAILSCADYLDRSGQRPVAVRAVLTALVKAYEIQGVLALDNAFNQFGLDHVLLVRLASAAAAAGLLGADRDAMLSALSNVWADGGALRVYRHAPNTGWRKSWAAGDAAARGVRHALMALDGEMACPSVLSTPQWGFEAVCLRGNKVTLAQPLGDYVIRNILFKVAFPAEFHAQTAVECALALHDRLAGRLDEIACIELFTQAAGKRIIDKSGPLVNPADRDHCLQYAVAVALLKGALRAEDYSDTAAADPRIDALRRKMQVTEDAQYSRDYLHPDKRAIANRVEVTLASGEVFREAQPYPLGHPRRREEALPHLLEKFESAATPVLAARKAHQLQTQLLDADQLDDMPVRDLMAQLVQQEAPDE